MQKNKLVHEDIKAVCISAAKKLVALGLVVAVGGTCGICGSSRHVASALSLFSWRRKNTLTEVKGSGRTLIEGDGFTAVKGSGRTLIEGDGFTAVTGGGQTLIEGDGFTGVKGDGDIAVTGSGRTLIEGDGFTAVKGSGRTLIEGDGFTAVTGSGRTLIEGDGVTAVTGGGDTTVKGSGRTLIEGDGFTAVTGNGRIYVKGHGRAIVEGNGDTIVKGDGYTLVEGASRLTVRRAASLEVNPDIAVTLPDGKKFTTASTLEETIDSAIDEDIFDRASGQTVSDPEQIDTAVVGAQKCHLDKNAHYLQNILEWAMRTFNLTNQELIDAVQHLPAQVD